jgi:DNA-binding NtrC family response regulator
MKSVLVVDDHQDIRTLLSIHFSKRFGSRIFEAESGTQAISWLKTIHVDLIVSDLRMYPGSGLDIVSYLMKNDLHVPFILFTSYTSFSLALERDYPDFLGVLDKSNFDQVVNLVHERLGWDFEQAVH